jgi:hypothetical protein
VFEDVATDKDQSIGDTVPVVFNDSGGQDLTLSMTYG